MWTWHTDTGLPEGQYSKHIYLGETRIVTKQTSDLEEHYGSSEELHHQYYYHPDHLGSAQLVTDYEGNEYQRIEYTPYGEMWVEKKTANEKDMRYLPYKFTAKEQDEETGLYYYGARYLDAKYSRWLSTDPAVGEYIPVAPTDDNTRKHNEKLPGMGGVFNVVNFQLYHYAGNNPVKYTDPDGREDDEPIILKSWEPKTPKKIETSAKGSLLPKYNRQEKTINQNKEQKAAWGEAIFVDGNGENSCYLQAGVYSLSTEMNDSPKNHNLYAQAQLDLLNADFGCEISDGGGGVSFGVNVVAVSGKFGVQMKIAGRNIKITLGGSAGVQAGGALQVDVKKRCF